MSLLMAILTSVELLTFCPQSPKGLQMFDALQQALRGSVKVTRTDKYQGQSDCLMLWGPGAPNRWPAMAYQAARHKPTLVFDLAYWQRDTKIRVSINDPHPQRWVMRNDWPASRLIADGIIICSDQWDPQGPVIVAGIGPKAKVQYGAATVEAWEREMIAACRAQGQTVRYRRKNSRGDAPNDVPSADAGTIEQALAGASLLVTWHSNAAVDAIRMGIPVICREGAAAAVCPSGLTCPPIPLASDVRDRFLANVAWFQWAPSEAGAMWAWLNEALA